nr:sulfatase-like hydrolase/transferase [Nitrososphaerota archaeon]
DLVSWMADSNLLQKTNIIFTADHGDSFGEGGRIQHVNVGDEVLHVPLIITNSPSGRVINSVVSHSDITPTVLDLMGLATSDERIIGESLLMDKFSENSEERNRGVLSIASEPRRNEKYISLRKGGLKYVRTIKTFSGSQRTVFEALLDVSHSFLESGDLRDVLPLEFKTMSLQADALLHGYQQHVGKALNAEDEAELRNRLSLLGYD